MPVFERAHGQRNQPIDIQHYGVIFAINLANVMNAFTCWHEYSSKADGLRNKRESLYLSPFWYKAKILHIRGILVCSMEVQM